MLKLKRNRQTLEDLAERLELPEEALLGTTRLTVTGGRYAVIENHRGLLEHDGGQIAVSTGKGRLILRGSALELNAMNQKELLICGQIHSADWE